MSKDATPVMTIDATQEVRQRLVRAAFNSVALRDRLRHLGRSEFPSGSLGLEQLEPLGEVELGERVVGGFAALVRLEPRMLAYVAAMRGQGEVAVAGAERETVDRVVASLAEALRDDVVDEGQVPVTFWAAAAGMTLSPRRTIAGPAWPEIRSNYAADTRSALDDLMAAAEPGPGRLLLWHGAPGTGKSFALRALAREWRDWCDVHFITDPDAYLGSRTGYLMSTLLRDDRRWRLIVLEDAGELLAADARAVAGQAVSRLLNVTDGLLGEGLRAMVLVTTNEPVRRLHEAVTRPGRCWARIEFGPLAAADADAWLHGRGRPGFGREATLAELYARADGRIVPERRTVGFGGAAA